MEDRTLRSGTYAVVDGVTYEAKLNSDSVSIFLRHAGERPQGWGWAGASTAYQMVDPHDVSELYRVDTEAKLDGVDVYVDQVDPVAREAAVRASNPRYSSINDQDKPPPHPPDGSSPEPALQRRLDGHRLVGPPVSRHRDSREDRSRHGRRGLLQLRLARVPALADKSEHVGYALEATNPHRGNAFGCGEGHYNSEFQILGRVPLPDGAAMWKITPDGTRTLVGRFTNELWEIVV